MNRSKLIGTFLATCLLFAAARGASAAALSMNPNACRLVSNVSPFPEMSCAPGYNNCALGGSGMFTNNSGVSAWGMCPVAWQDGANNFLISTSSTTAACYLIAVGTWGGGSTVYTGSRSGNQVYFTVPLTAGSYNAEIQCFIPNGTSIWGGENY